MVYMYPQFVLTIWSLWKPPLGEEGQQIEGGFVTIQ